MEKLWGEEISRFLSYYMISVLTCFVLFLQHSANPKPFSLPPQLSARYVNRLNSSWRFSAPSLIRKFDRLLERSMRNVGNLKCLYSNFDSLRHYNQYCILYSWIYCTWPLRKHDAYKQATRGPTALSPFQETRQWG